MIFVANLTLRKSPKKTPKKYSTYEKKKKKNSPPNENFNTKETLCIISHLSACKLLQRYFFFDSMKPSSKFLTTLLGFDVFIKF
jgi:hypothetical protein